MADACSASASEAKTLHASAAAATRSTHTLQYSAAPFGASAVQSPPPQRVPRLPPLRPSTSRWRRRRREGLWRLCGNRAKVPRDDVRTTTTMMSAPLFTMSGRRGDGVLGSPSKIIEQPMDGFATFWAVTHIPHQTFFVHNLSSDRA